MSADERPLRRSLRIRIQLIIIAALIIVFACFIMSQFREISVVRANVESEEKKIVELLSYKEQLNKEYDFIKDKEFIIGQGRDRLGLVMENDIIYIKRVVD